MVLNSEDSVETRGCADALSITQIASERLATISVVAETAVREARSVGVNVQTTTRASGTTRVVGTTLVGVVVDESGADEVTAAGIRVKVDLDRSGRGQGGDGEEAGEVHCES